MAIADRKTNADLMVDCRELGYINGRVLDLTYGLGRFWSKWQPDNLFASDLDPEKSPIGFSMDFTATCYPDRYADTVVLDPPYKLNGRSTEEVDSQYGVAGAYTPADARHQLMRDGITEAARILKPGGRLLFKCQDQVSSGKVHWQTRTMADHGESTGFLLDDMMFFPSYRKQPEGRRQVHARRNYSTLLVFRKVAS